MDPELVVGFVSQCVECFCTGFVEELETWPASGAGGLAWRLGDVDEMRTGTGPFSLGL